MAEPPRPTYTPEEAAEILKRALKQQSMKDQGLTHEELVEMAAEVGIDRGALEAATEHVTEARAAELARQAEAHELAQERSRLFNRFVSSLLVYVLVNTLLYFIDMYFTRGAWFFYVLIGWGIGLAFQLRSVFFPQASLERRKRHELRRAMKEERRAARHARRQRFAQVFSGDVHDHADHAARARHEFEAAVQTGVNALLQAAARKIHDHAERGSLQRDGSPRRR